MPRPLGRGILDRLLERETGFHDQRSSGCAALLQFCDVPPARDRSAWLDHSFVHVELGGYAGWPGTGAAKVVAGWWFRPGVTIAAGSLQAERGGAASS
jgi:hypothetical protein